MPGELSPASVYVSLLPVVEARRVVAVPGGPARCEVRGATDEPEALGGIIHTVSCLGCHWISPGLRGDERRLVSYNASPPLF